MKTYAHLWQYLTQFFVQWEMFQTKFVQKIKTHILCSTSFSPKSCHVWDNVEKYGRSWQATNDSITWCMHFAFWITKATDTQILASPQQQRLHKHPSVLCFPYTECLAHLSTLFLHLLHLHFLTAFSDIYMPSVVYVHIYKNSWHKGLAFLCFPPGCTTHQVSTVHYFPFCWSRLTSFFM